jgi:hypothetical protein
MANQELEEFAKLVMERVRDVTIDDWNALIEGRIRGPSGTIVQNAISDYSEAQKQLLAERIVPEIVDYTLHHFFRFIDGFESVTVHSVDSSEPSGELIDRDDALANRLYGEDGWIARFSQRYTRYRWSGSEDR